MPSQRPCAAFDPISPNLDLPQLVEETPNFEYVTRISCDMIEEQGLDSFDKLVLLHVILGGKPLVIEGFQYRLDEWTFTGQWLQDNCGKKFEQARNLSKHQNMALSIGHYLSNMSKLTDQWSADNYKEPDRQRIYLKDIDCPPIWHDKLREQIPPSVFYLNESTGEFGGPGSLDPNEQGAVRAGDLMSCLPPAMRADNMMCYIGHEGTYTPAHREMCASLGQNLMVETSGVRGEDGKPAKPGSSIWFMTETNDRHLVSEYWLSTLGHDIEVESHFAQINAWKAAPFKTYIVDQRVGDFILIPPLAPHQVWNRGTRTMKAAWNRTTVETLEMALHEALPRARMVCRDEQYKNKAIVYFALEKYSAELKQVQSQKKPANQQLRYELGHSLKIRQLHKDFKRLFALFTEILLSEMLAPVSTAEKRGQYLPFDSFVTCSYCRCNIFNRFLTCTSCVAPLENGDEDTYDICMDCYAMGRSCSCLSKYKWVEQFPWQDLVQKHESWRHLIIDFEGGVHKKSPVPLQTERKNLNKKTLAQVCQEQLKARPYVDPTKPAAVVSAFDRRHPLAAAANREDQEVEVDDAGKVKKSNSKKTRAEKLPKGWVIEHVSCYPEVEWKVATCAKCSRNYSYGSLYRMFDLMPQTVMENLEWECPACLKICSCGACRKKADVTPHEPTGTVLGHDTKKVADPRSVESLVNYSLPNLGWIKRTGDDHPHESRRLSRRRDEAERAKAKDPALDDNYVDEEEYAPPMNNPPNESGIRYNTEADLAIDPMLLMDQPTVHTNGRTNIQSGDSDYTESTLRRNESEDSSMEGVTPPPSSSPRGNEERGHNIAPIANMISQDDQGLGFTSNGIAYKYPDPEIPQSTSTFQTQQFAQPERSTPKQRRSETSIVTSDLARSTQADINGQQLTQLEQMLEDAKLNDRYISTEAAFTGKALRITLSLSKTKLAAAVNRPPMPMTSRPAVNGVRAGPPIILQSDFPSVAHTEQPNVSKKRKSRTENDDDFTARKRKDPKFSVAQALAKGTRKKSVKYTEPSSDSEFDAQEGATSFVPINKPRGPRPLPKYIVQRTEDNPPSSLDELPGRRSSHTQKQPQAPVTGKAEGQRDHLTSNSPPPSARPPRSVTFATNGETLPKDSSSAPEPPLEPDTNTKVSIAESRDPNLPPVPQQRLAEEGQKAKMKAPPTSPAVPPQKLAQNDRKPKTKAVPADPAQKLAEDNRKAKMKALQWADEDEDTFSSDTLSSDHTPVKSTKPKAKAMATPKSIFSRPGVDGRKMKIVMAKSPSGKGKAASKAVDIAKRSLKAL